MIFGALVVILIAVALAILIIPVITKPAPVDSQNRDQQNIQIAREKKAQLEEQLANGQMSEDEYQSAMADLEASLALDLERHQGERAIRLLKRTCVPFKDREYWL